MSMLPRRSRRRASAVRAASYAAAQPPPATDLPPKREPKPDTGTGPATFAAACLAANIALAATLLGGTPLVRADWDPLFAAVGTAATVLTTAWAAHTFRRTRAGKARTLIAIAALLAAAGLTVGALSNPVIVNGRVSLDTSTTASQVRYATDMRNNLYLLRDLDTYLASPDAQAWSDKRTLTRNREQAANIAATYQKTLDGDGPPAGQLADPTRRTMTAAYTLVKAYDTKDGLLKEDNDELRKQLDAQRKQFAEQLVSAGASLTEAVNALNIPVPLANPQE